MPSLAERFEAKIERIPFHTCWEWMGAVSRDPQNGGYGSLAVGGKPRWAHRVSYELYAGPIPEGLTLDHLCRNRACVNPAHLEPVTRKENILRGESPQAKNARKTHCPEGHPLAGDNLFPEAKGRSCRECRVEATRRWRERNPEQAQAADRRRNAKRRAALAAGLMDRKGRWLVPKEARHV